MVEDGVAIYKDIDEEMERAVVQISLDEFMKKVETSSTEDANQ